MEEIVPEIGHVVMLREGALFKAGPTHELLNDATLSALFGWEMEVRQAGGFYGVRLR